MTAFIAYPANSALAADLILSLMRFGIRARTENDLLPEETREARTIQALHSSDVIVVIWPEDDGQWSSLLRAAVRAGQDQDKLIVVGRRGARFGKLLVYRLVYIDEDKDHLQLGRAIEQLEQRQRNNVSRDHGFDALLAMDPEHTAQAEPPTIASIIKLDTRLLASGSDPVMLTRAEELQHFELRRQVRARTHVHRSYSRSDVVSLREYFETYGAITPWLMVGVLSTTTEDDMLKYLVLNAPAQLISGRFVIFTVEGDKSALRQKPFLHPLLRENMYFARVNGSPVQDQLYEELALHTARKASRTFTEWITEYHNGNRQEEVQQDALSQLMASTGDVPFHFVSYSREDAQITTSIVDALEAQGIRCWFDTKSILGGEIFLKSITVGLKRCFSVLPVCSIPFSRSKWCQREILFADQLEKPFRPVWLTNPALEDQM